MKRFTWALLVSLLTACALDRAPSGAVTSSLRDEPDDAATARDASRSTRVLAERTPERDGADSPHADGAGGTHEAPSVGDASEQPAAGAGGASISPTPTAGAGGTGGADAGLDTGAGLDADAGVDADAGDGGAPDACALDAAGCEAESACAPADERCNARDDDCDGAVDEDFRDAGGEYVHDAHCGACDAACGERIAGSAQEQCVAAEDGPRCEVLACAPGHFQSGPLTCAPASIDTCAACAEDTDCPTPGDSCITVAGARVCGYDCSAGNAHGTPAGVCPAGFTCSAVAGGVAQCIPESGTCACLAENAGATRPCSRSNAYGSCSGVETCDPENGWVGCDAETPEPERCDGLDNDCDSVADDGACSACTSPAMPEPDCGASRRCRPTTGDVGICEDAGAGVQADPCRDSADCGPGFLCARDVGAEQAYCNRLCRFGHDEDCAGAELCYGFVDAISIGGLEWGVCDL